MMHRVVKRVEKTVSEHGMLRVSPMGSCILPAQQKAFAHIAELGLVAAKAHELSSSSLRSDSAS